MKKLLIAVVVLVAVLALLAGGLLWALKDPNRFKPQLETLISDTTGLQVKLTGDLSWQLWPPVVLKGQDISFEDDESRYEIGSVGVKANLMSLITGGGELVIDQLRVADTRVIDKKFGDVIQVDALRLDDFAFGTPSPLFLQAQLESEGEPPVSVRVEGPLTYFDDEDRLTLKPMRFSYDGIQGQCDVAASQLSREPAIVAQETRDDVLPLDTFRAMNWQAQCTVPEYVADGASFRNIAIDATNKDGRSNNVITIPDALGGSVKATAAIDTTRRTPQWRIKTDADALQAQALMDMIAPTLKWVAPLLAGGELTMQGNTPEALVNSMSGELSFDSSEGLIDIAVIKEAVSGIAALAGQSETLAGWPEQLSYLKLDGSWKPKGTRQSLRFALDNVKLTGDGIVNPLTGELDLASAITIDRHPSLDALPVNDALYGLPIPIRCTGTLEEPSCGLDRAGAQKALAGLAAGKARDKVNEELSDVIDDKVPEEYRDTAREALKGLGGLFGGKKDDDE
jgi:hypothetical protein